MCMAMSYSHDYISCVINIACGVCNDVTLLVRCVSVVGDTCFVQSSHV